MILEKIIGWFAPHECLGCGAEGSLVCEWCLPDFVQPLPDRCYVCHAVSINSRVCSKHRSPVRHVWVHTHYTASAKRILHKLKFERASAAADPIAQLLVDTLPYFDANKTIISHIPTASRRVRMRGYDQAECIARRVAQLKGVPYRPVLARLGHTRQVGANRDRRKTQLQHAFRLIDFTVSDKHIVLIDDVVTTGATIEAAALCLKSADVKHIDAAVFAQRQ